MTIEITVASDTHDLADQAAELFVDQVTRVLLQRERANVVVTGGSTGIAVLGAIAQQPAAIDWSRVHVWWGDERFVPHDSGERNDVQADHALLRHVAIPAKNVHRMGAPDGTLGDDPDAAAEAYATELAQAARDNAPLFDLLMLGVGEEGHTASIFPYSAATADQRLTCAVRNCPKPPPTRVTMTQRLLSDADQVWLMTAGASKAQSVAAALGGANPRDIPAAGPRGRTLTRWLLDPAAAAGLPR